MIPLARFVPASGGWIGRPSKDRLAIACAFVAKAVYGFHLTRQLLERLHQDAQLRRICGWEYAHQIPHESTFSRAFAEFAAMELPQFVHEAIEHVVTRRDLDQGPGQRHGGRIVASDQDRDERVAHFLVVERRTVFVPRRDQVVEDVLPSRRPFAPPPGGDEREQVVVEVPELPEDGQPPRAAQPVERHQGEERQGERLPEAGDEPVDLAPDAIEQWNQAMISRHPDTAAKKARFLHFLKEAGGAIQIKRVHVPHVNVDLAGQLGAERFPVLLQDPVDVVFLPGPGGLRINVAADAVPQQTRLAVAAARTEDRLERRQLSAMACE